MLGMPNITPFTYRDGSTYLNELELYKRYLERNLIPWVQTNYDALAADFIVQVNLLITAVNMAIEAVINDSITVQDPVVEALVEQADSLTRVALDTLIDSKDAVIYDQVTNDIAASYASLVTVINTEISNLKAVYTTYRVWNGAAYPARIPGSLNIFFGPTDPGLAMAESDYWANPNVTTLDTVVAEALDSSSELYAAIQDAAATVQTVPIELFDSGSTILKTVIGAAPSRVVGYALPNAGLPALFGFARIPDGWDAVTLVFRWTTSTVEAAASTNVRFFADTVAVPTNGAIGVGNRYSGTVAIPISQTNKLFVENNATTVVGGSGFSIAITRDAANAADTYVGDAIILDAWLVKA
jgi:hypothetical protein